MTGDEEIEIDVLAYATGDINQAYVVEVQSHLDERAIEQLLDLLARFPRLFSEHGNKALYGVLAYIQGSQALRRRVLEAGLCLASIHDEHLRLKVPEGFLPRHFETSG